VIITVEFYTPTTENSTREVENGNDPSNNIRRLSEEFRQYDHEHANGIETNGIETNGIETNGIETNGVEANGVEANGIKENGIEENGFPIMHNRVAHVRRIKLSNDFLDDPDDVINGTIENGDSNNADAVFDTRRHEEQSQGKYTSNGIENLMGADMREIISDDIKAYLAGMIEGVTNNSNIDELSVEIKKENKTRRGDLSNTLPNGTSKRDETDDSGNISSSTTSSETHTTNTTSSASSSNGKSNGTKKMSKFVFPKQMSIVDYRRAKFSGNHSEDENFLSTNDDSLQDTTTGGDGERKSSIADISDASDDPRQRKKYYRHSKKDVVRRHHDDVIDGNLSSGEEGGQHDRLEMTSLERLNNRQTNSRTRSESSENGTTATMTDVNSYFTQRFNDRHKVADNGNL